MTFAIPILIASQLMFTVGDLLARSAMREGGFHVATFLAPWFVAYTLLRTAATFGQLYVFATVELGRTMALFGATSIVLSNVLAVLVLQEVLSPTQYIGVSLVIVALLLLAWR